MRHVSLDRKIDCCGCSACSNVCPIDAIKMTSDKEGCEYPRVDESVCIDCGKCVKACPIASRKDEVAIEQEAFLVQHKDTDVLRESTSGGAFTAIAQQVISAGGVVYGHGYEPDAGDGEVRCFGVEEVSDLSLFRNSKYVQSKVGLAFREVHAQLKEGRKVLFSGTPCQCEGLLSYLGGKPEKLIVVDVVCRAVPCPSAFSAYKVWLEHETGKRAHSVRFRDKRAYGYRYSNICAFERGQSEPFYAAGVDSDPYLRAFFADACDRPSCYACAFKKRYRESDITLWDCFEVGEFCTTLDNNRGATRVLVHSQKGRDVMARLGDVATVVPLDVENALSNGAYRLQHSVTWCDLRDDFMALVSAPPEMSWEAYERYFPQTARTRVECAARRLLARCGGYDQAKKAVKHILGKVRRADPK
ncbi:Coenzyme F420 hydrogenase/dehydrogenase, beta subunit C-terminal domain [Paratractidigestivibacter sp.]|uniref:Coenzyme F420 hydrogenase/dehydrogenase, beta subunit C-terminal domain n=1 Tax=Paratractidigestivibacter sp. TaxID=2847316 RepID=UPI002ABD1973|nr:Coenzyme F420 hydrogenase/dehydrogenase, beta subunit C-terminal domain [Paratractidigestivibacter sp.]